MKCRSFQTNIFPHDHLKWLAWLKFLKCDILLFFIVKVLFILNTDAQVLKKISFDNSIYIKYFSHPFHHENIF